jgi:PAS domain S-box-containing protein
MIDSNDKNESLSGYLIINEEYLIEELSGEIGKILRNKNSGQAENLKELIGGLKKKTKTFFEEEVIPALETKTIQSLTLDRKKNQLSLSITPLRSGTVVLSFQETGLTDKRAEETIHEKLNEVLIKVNQDLRITYISRNFRLAFDKNKTEILFKKLDECNLFSGNTSHLINLLSTVFEKNERQSSDILISGKQSSIWWNATIVSENNAENDEETAWIILRNINEQKATEEKLKESETRYQMAIEAADLGVWDFFVGTNKSFYSRKWKSILGYYPDEIQDKFSVWEDLLHPDDKDRMVLFINNFMQSDLRIYEAEFRMRHKNGHYVWIRSRATAMRDEHGKVIRMLGTHRDITEEKKSESEYKKLYQAIMQSPISVLITDKDGYIEFFNPAFCKVTGWKDQEILGKKPNILKSGFQPASFYEKLWKTISSGNEWQGEFKNKRKNGEYYWELASISPIKNIFGTITHYVKIAENISYLKKIEKDLKKAKHEAEQANTYKNNFIANMSHEIRTPINSIIGFSELLRHESLSQQRRAKYSEIIEENSQSLLRLIDDIIDLAKIEANELKIKKEACSLGELYTELELTYNNFLKRKQNPNIKLMFRIPPDSHHDVIFTDSQRLRQIINNLFINALKNTEHGQIEIGYNILTANKIHFFVSDTGKGIPSAQLKNIFKRFIQTENTIHPDSTGAGLGLSISKDLAELLGGDINVKSVEGEGSVFSLIIPYDKIKIPMLKTRREVSVPSKYDFANYTIMIAEDTPNNYEYLYAILNKTGANLIWAKDGIDVLKLYKNSKVDLILMDIQLPEINGYDATLEIRKQNQALPIIAQTAYAMDEDRQRCIESGCNEVLVKPIRMDDVLSTVARYLNK